MNVALIFIFSFIAMLWAANHLVTGVANITTRMQLSSFIIGLTLVAFGTAIPEIIIMILHFLKSKNNHIIGNALASNIANISLVLGISIILKPLSLHYNYLKKTFCIIIIIMLFSYSLILDGFLGKIDGCLFLIACTALIAFFIYLADHAPKKDLFFIEFKSAVSSKRSLKTSIVSVSLGLILLPISAKYCLDSAIECAGLLRVSQQVIDLATIAIGTTLPSLVTAVTAAIKGEEDLASGTILGANFYSLLLILIFPTLITPVKISSTVLWRDIPVMLSITLLLYFLNFLYKKELSAWHGGILLVVYFSYVVSLFIKVHF